MDDKLSLSLASSVFSLLDEPKTAEWLINQSTAIKEMTVGYLYMLMITEDHLVHLQLTVHIIPYSTFKWLLK